MVRAVVGFAFGGTCVRVIGLHPWAVEEYIDEMYVTYNLQLSPKTLMFAGRVVAIHPEMGPLDLHVQ